MSSRPSDVPIGCRQIDIIAWSPRSSDPPIDLTEHIRKGVVRPIPHPGSFATAPLAFEVSLRLNSKQPAFRKAVLELFAERKTVLLHIALRKVDEVFFGPPAWVDPGDLPLIDQETVTFRVISRGKTRLEPYF